MLIPELHGIKQKVELKAKDGKAMNLASAITQTVLKAIHKGIDGKKAVGTDGVNKWEYEENLDENIECLISKMKNGSYRPNPSRRTYIDKPGSSKKRPLGISCYEDKLVEKAVAQLLEIVYEPRYLKCSYGFRPERNCHQAICEVVEMIQYRKTNYVVEADIRSFFDTLNHEWLITFLEHDIADRKFIEIIRKMLKAGVLENGKLLVKEEGSPQGGLCKALHKPPYAKKKAMQSKPRRERKCQKERQFTLHNNSRKKCYKSESQESKSGLLFQSGKSESTRSG